MKAWSRWRAWLLADTPALSAGERGRAAVGALLGIGLCGLLLHALPGPRWLIAPVGASAVILFALSHSPLAQPWSVVGAYLFATLAGLFSVHALPLAPMAAGVAVGASIWLTARFNCIHPPAGALALLLVLDGPHELEASISFIGVIAANVFGMLGAAVLINNLLLGRRYPYRAQPSTANVHQTQDKPPLARISLTHADLDSAVRELDTFIDVQEEELIRLYNLAVGHAFDRHIGLTCGDIMSRDLVTIRPDTGIELAWRELRTHKIRALPVVDDTVRLVGVLTVADFLRQMDDTSAAGLAVRLQGLLRRESGALRAETAGQIMTTQVRTAHAGTPVAELVRLLSDQGMHHVPVVDNERRVIGMVTQSDLIAALYARIALTLA